MRLFIALLKPLSFLPAIAMMYVIFTFSGQDAQTSAALSYKVSYKIVEVADEILDAGLEDWEKDSLANRFHNVTRKLAHMGEYFALAISVAFPLYVYGLRGIALVLAAGLFCVAFACTDEYHQSFVAGRGPQAKDVGIDSIGILAGILLVRIIGWTGRMTIFRPLRKAARHERSRNPDSPAPQQGCVSEQGYGPQPGSPGAQRDYVPQPGYPAAQQEYIPTSSQGTRDSARGHHAGPQQPPSLSRRERRRQEKELQKSLPPSDRLSDDLRPGRVFRRFRK